MADNSLPDDAGGFVRALPSPMSSLESFNEALYRKIFDINVLGSLNIARIGSRHLKAASMASVRLSSRVMSPTTGENRALAGCLLGVTSTATTCQPSS